MLGKWWVFVVSVINYNHAVSGFLQDGMRSGPRALVELEVGFPDGGTNQGSGLVDAKRELHLLDSPGLSVLAGLTVVFLLNGTLLNHVRGVIAFKVRGLKFFTAPGKQSQYG